MHKVTWLLVCAPLLLATVIDVAFAKPTSCPRSSSLTTHRFMARYKVGLPCVALSERGTWSCDSELTTMLRSRETVKNMANFIPKSLLSQVYIFGGAIREALLSLDCEDIDATIKLNSGQSWEEHVGCNRRRGYVQAFLDRKRVKYHSWGSYEHPKCDYKVPLGFVINAQSWNHFDLVSPNLNIDQELSRRDFTINTLALALQSPYKNKEKVLDPTMKGMDDLRTKTIRIPIEDTELWCSVDLYNCDVKVMRYFHMRMKGFNGERATRQVILERMKLWPSSKKVYRTGHKVGMVFTKVLLPCGSSDCEDDVPERARQLLNLFVDDYLLAYPSHSMSAATSAFKEQLGPLWEQKREVYPGMMPVESVTYQRGYFSRTLSQWSPDSVPYGMTSADCVRSTMYALGVTTFLNDKTMRSMRRLKGRLGFDIVDQKSADTFFTKMEDKWSLHMTQYPGAVWATREFTLRTIDLLNAMGLNTGELAFDLDAGTKYIPGTIDYDISSGTKPLFATLINEDQPIRVLLAFAWYVIDHTRVTSRRKVRVSGNNLHYYMNDLREKDTDAYSSLLEKLSSRLYRCVVPDVSTMPCSTEKTSTVWDGWTYLNDFHEMMTLADGRKPSGFRLRKMSDKPEDKCIFNDQVNPPFTRDEIEQCVHAKQSRKCSSYGVFNMGKSHYKLLFNDEPSPWPNARRQYGYVMQSRLNSFRNVAGPSASVHQLLEFARNILGMNYAEVQLLRLALVANMAQTDGHSFYEGVVGADTASSHSFMKLEGIEHLDIFSSLLNVDAIVPDNAGARFNSRRGDIRYEDRAIGLVFTKEHMQEYMRSHGIEPYALLEKLVGKEFLKSLNDNASTALQGLCRRFSSHGGASRTIALGLKKKAKKMLGYSKSGWAALIARHMEAIEECSSLDQVMRNLKVVHSMVTEVSGSLDINSQYEELINEMLRGVNQYFYNSNDFAVIKSTFRNPKKCQFEWEVDTAPTHADDSMAQKYCARNVAVRRSFAHWMIEKNYKIDGLWPDVDMLSYGKSVYKSVYTPGSKMSAIVGYYLDGSVLIRLPSISGDEFDGAVVVEATSTTELKMDGVPEVIDRMPRSDYFGSRLNVVGGPLVGVEKVAVCGVDNRGIPQAIINGMSVFIHEVATPSNFGLIKSDDVAEKVDSFLKVFEIGHDATCLFPDGRWKRGVVSSINSDGVVTCQNVLKDDALVPGFGYVLGEGSDDMQMSLNDDQSEIVRASHDDPFKRLVLKKVKTLTGRAFTDGSATVLVTSVVPTSDLNGAKVIASVFKDSSDTYESRAFMIRSWVLDSGGAIANFMVEAGRGTVKYSKSSLSLFMKPLEGHIVKLSRADGFGVFLGVSFPGGTVVARYLAIDDMNGRSRARTRELTLTMRSVESITSTNRISKEYQRKREKLEQRCHEIAASFPFMNIYLKHRYNSGGGSPKLLSYKLDESSSMFCKVTVDWSVAGQYVHKFDMSKSDGEISPIWEEFKESLHSDGIIEVDLPHAIRTWEVGKCVVVDAMKARAGDKKFCSVYKTWDEYAVIENLNADYVTFRPWRDTHYFGVYDNVGKGFRNIPNRKNTFNVPVSQLSGLSVRTCSKSELKTFEEDRLRSQVRELRVMLEGDRQFNWKKNKKAKDEVSSASISLSADVRGCLRQKKLDCYSKFAMTAQATTLLIFSSSQNSSYISAWMFPDVSALQSFRHCQS